MTNHQRLVIREDNQLVKYYSIKYFLRRNKLRLSTQALAKTIPCLVQPSVEAQFIAS